MHCSTGQPSTTSCGPTPQSPLNPHYFSFHFPGLFLFDPSRFRASSFEFLAENVGPSFFWLRFGVLGTLHRCFWPGAIPSDDPLISGAVCDPLCLDPPSRTRAKPSVLPFPCRPCSPGQPPTALCDTAPERCVALRCPQDDTTGLFVPNVSQNPSLLLFDARLDSLDRPVAIASHPPCSLTEKSGLARPV